MRTYFYIYNPETDLAFGDFQIAGGLECGFLRRAAAEARAEKLMRPGRTLQIVESKYSSFPHTAGYDAIVLNRAGA